MTQLCLDDVIDPFSFFLVLSLDLFYLGVQGCTPLHIAAQQNHEEVFDLLVKIYGESTTHTHTHTHTHWMFPTLQRL